MASSSSPKNSSNPSLSPTGFDPNPDMMNITFVQADPSTFRSVVQRLTGAAPQKQNFGVTIARRSPFKLHDRRPTAAKKLEINKNGGGTAATTTTLRSPSSARTHRSYLGYNTPSAMASPVSPLEYPAAARGVSSPKTPVSPVEEEERAIAQKGFYLHPSPLSTQRGSDPPDLLPLFPVRSLIRHL